jgi:hypothetical protein
VLLHARHLADRVMRVAGNDVTAQVRQLYRIALSREPSQNELNGNLEFLRKQREYQAAKASGSGSGSSSEQSADLGALTDLAHVMLNYNEFVYIN